MPFEQRHISGWSFYYDPELEGSGIRHGFFDRESPSHEFTGEDKQLFLDAFQLSDLIVMAQEHGDQVHIIRSAERPSTGDGMVLVKKGVAGIIKTADCMPVIIADPVYPMAAIVHAGWRGTAFRIAQKAVRTMVGLGAAKERITALLGPSIRSCCYKVGEDVRGVFRKEAFDDAIFGEVNGELFLDLADANRRILEEEGVREIYDTGLCTYHNESFASYRRGEHHKRQISFVSLKDRV